MRTRWKELDEEEKHDLEVLRDRRYLQLGKYVLGNDPRIEGPRMRKRRKDTSDTILYADDLGARESAETMMELEEKTEAVIVKLYKVMRDSRLAVNNDKTQIMCLASARKRAAMKDKGEAEKMKITVEGHTIT
jgi:hypothetical protein